MASEEIKFSNETQDIINNLKDYLAKVKSRGWNSPVFPKESPNSVLDNLGTMRDSLRFPLDEERTFKLSHYCFSMLRNFGIAALYDRYILWFLEALQFKNTDEYYARIRYLLFPKGISSKSRLRKAEQKAYPRYKKVYNTLVKLNFKKGFNNPNEGILRLKNKFPKEMGRLSEEIIEYNFKPLVQNKLVSKLADAICATEFDIRPSSFPKVRQQSRKLHASSQ